MPGASTTDGRGRIVVAGNAGRHVGVARLTAEGRLDRSFGEDGLVIRRMRRTSYATSVAVAADGSVTVTARRWADTWSSDGFIVVRFAADGTPDPTFGSRGLSEISFGTENAEASDVALDTHGRTVAVGYAYTPQSATALDIAVARLR